MSESAKETLARVDAILARLEAGKASQNAQGAIAASLEQAAQSKRLARAAARSQRASGIIARLDREAEERRKTFVPPKPVNWGPSMLNISCGTCGYDADALEFYNDAFGFERPRGEIQCPKCKWAVRREWRDGDIRLTPTDPTL